MHDEIARHALMASLSGMMTKLYCTGIAMQPQERLHILAQMKYGISLLEADDMYAADTGETDEHK